MEIHFVSADKRGFEISRKMIHDDMGYKIDLVPSNERVKWIESNYNLMDTIYMGDGFFDDLIMFHASDAVSAYWKRFKCSSSINPRSAKYSKLIILFQYSLPKSMIGILVFIPV